MSTNSLVARKLKNGSVVSTYVHWDGHPAVVGKMLVKNYNKECCAREVCRVGYISALLPTIEETKAGSRNKERYEKHMSVIDYIRFASHKYCSIEYIYLWEDGDWKVAKMNEIHLINPSEEDLFVTIKEFVEAHGFNYDYESDQLKTDGAFFEDEIQAFVNSGRFV